MKKFLLVFVLASVILSACNVAQKSLYKGNYDLAINQGVRKLRKKPNDLKHLSIVEEAFNKAVDRDRRKIEFMKQEGNPDIWDRVFQMYNSMKQRQELVRTLNTIPSNIVFANYNDEIIAAKKNAAEYYYAHAIQMLSNNDRGSGRLAHAELLKVKGFYANFKDTDQKLNEAKILGTANVLFDMKNVTGTPLPPQLEVDLRKIAIADLNSQWINYYKKPQADLYMDYTVWVNMKLISPGVESVKTKEYTEEKTVADGFSYQLDASGNVMRDTLGNDIKIPKTKVIKCKVIENIQTKSARVSGSIDYIDNRTNEMIKSEPVTADHNFLHRSAMAIGDVNALTEETKKIIGVQPIPFPDNAIMVLNAGETLKALVKDVIFRNKTTLR